MNTLFAKRKDRPAVGFCECILIKNNSNFSAALQVLQDSLSAGSERYGALEQNLISHLTEELLENRSHVVFPEECPSLLQYLDTRLAGMRRILGGEEIRSYEAEDEN